MVGCKKLVTLLDLCVSSLRRGHANLLCIVPILTDDPRRESTGQDSRNNRPQPKVQEGPHHSFLAALTMEALATWHLVLRRPPAEVGGWGGVEPMRESPSSGPSESCDCHVPLLSLILPLPHLRRRRLCVCACVHLGPLSVESNFAKLLGRTHLSNLTIGARHALHSHWRLPLFAYCACLRGLGHA